MQSYSKYKTFPAFQKVRCMNYIQFDITCTNLLFVTNGEINITLIEILLNY